MERHFADLATEKGNADLRIIFEYIRTKSSEKYKFLVLKKFELEDLLKKIMEENTNKLELQSIDSLKNLLIDNGIISEKFYSQGVEYSFAFLYKYYLGLKSRPWRY